MDTVSMLNKMSFYCQPILPLVYDESMSYYETLCKVVGQLNTTGETVNKLNEGLTGEVADRQTADAELDARIKEIEKTNKKFHFLKVDTLGHLLTENVTREKLSQWVQDGDIIAMLYAPDEQENSWAVATNYRCLGARGAETMQLSFYVPISIVHNAGKSGSDVAQEVVVISLPVGELANQWVVRSITTTIPATNADGFVNLMASVGDDGAVTCDVEPGAIVEALRNYFRSTNQFAVAVNARLNYDGKQYHSSAATVKADASGAGNIRIAFENYYGGVRAENGVSQTVNTTIFLVGDVKTNVWTVETIDHKTFDFSRYEGFQFTRGAHNVISTNDESTPNAVFAQYHSGTSGKLYQNLPTRLIDTVDNAEYWNGVFDIKDGNHMTFTFVTSNYTTASDKMLVRVIELSANVNTTAWKYAEKEFTIPLSDSDSLYVDFWPVGTGETYNEELKAYVVELAANQTFDAIFDSINAGHKTVARLYNDETKSGFPDSSVDVNISGDKNLGTINFHFLSVDASNIAGFAFIGEVISLIKTSSSTLIFISLGANALPVPNGDGTDNGKVPTVNGTRWEMKKSVVDSALSDTSTNPVQNKVVKSALDGKASTEVASQTTNGLMSKDDKKKLDGVAEGANKTIVDEMLSDGSTNPVQNKAITAALDRVVRETIYPIAVTATSADWTVTNGIAYKEATADRTFDAIKAAYNGNKTLVCEFERMTYSLILSSTTAFIFASYRGAVANDSQYSGLGKYPTSLITITTTGVGISRTAGDLPAVDGTDNDKMLIVSGGEWALQRVPGTTVDAELSTTSENPVQNKTVTAALNSKLPKTGGTVTGALRTNDSFSAGGTISFGEAPIGLSQTADGAAEIRYGNADVNDNPPPLSRLKVARPTADDDAATKAYVDGKAVAPILTSPVMIRKEGATDSAGVYLSTVGTGEKSAEIMLEDVNENAPVAIANLRTPTGAGADNYAATKGYVDSKVASVGSADVVINGTIGDDGTVTLDKTYDQIKEAVQGVKKAFARIVALDDASIGYILPLTSVLPSKISFGSAINSVTTLGAEVLTVKPSSVSFHTRNAPAFNSYGAMRQVNMEGDPTSSMQIATKQYVDDHLSGAPITIKLGTGNAATSTATFAEIKAALEAGKAPILDSAPGTSHWFALNWTLSGSGSLSIQYGTFNVEGGGMANFTLYNVSVSSTGITYSSSQFTTE